MIESRAGKLWHKALSVYYRQGLVSLVKQSTLYLLANGLMYKQIVLYENDFKNIPANNHRRENWTLKRITKPVEVEELLEQGFDFDSYKKFYRDTYDLKGTLAKGVVLFAVFADKHLAHTTFVAYNDNAKQDIDIIPYRVKFEAGEVSHGGSETSPRYRLMGIHSYALREMFLFLRESGCSVDKFAVVKTDAISRHVVEKLGSKVCGRGTLIKVLVWPHWHERS